MRAFSTQVRGGGGQAASGARAASIPFIRGGGVALLSAGEAVMAVEGSYTNWENLLGISGELQAAQRGRSFKAECSGVCLCCCTKSQ